MRLASILFLLLWQQCAFAQQCGYDKYYLFVVKVHAASSQETIPGLRMYLADELGNPRSAEVIYQEKGQWKERKEILYFWQNEKLKKEDGTRPLVRRNFFHIGPYYIVAFPIDHVKNRDPLQQPVYTLQIEAGTNPQNGQRFPAQQFHLPLAKAVWVCNNGILEDFKLVQPVRCFDGSEYQPIDITLNEQTNPGVVADNQPGYPQYLLRVEYSRSTNPAAYNRKEFTVKGINVYNNQTGKLQQHIAIPGKAVALEETKERLVTTGDFFQRKIKEAQDFAVTIETWRDTVFAVERERNWYYIFNNSTKQYEADELLNRETDVYYYAGTQKMRRLEYLVTERSKITRTWELENRKWKLVDTREELFPAFKPPPRYAPATCLLFTEKYHRLPLQAVNGTNASIVVRDSFRLYNNCGTALRITSVKSSTRDFFSIPQVLPPREYVTLSFQGLLRSSSFDFMTKSFQCYLELEDGTNLSFGIDIPVVSNNSNVVYRKDGSVAYAITGRKGARFATAIFTNPDGAIRAKGTVQDGDTSLKTGKWQYYNEGDWRMTEVVYSKAVYLSSVNQPTSYTAKPFRVKIRENGKWKEPVTQEENYQQLVYITAATDSLVAYTDSLSYGYHLPYQTLPDVMQLSFYLLKPGEPTIKIGYYQTPFRLIADNYTLLPDYSRPRRGNKTTEQLMDSFITAWQKRYPDIDRVQVSRHVQGVSLSRLSKQEKKQVLAQLKADSSFVVCQLFTLSDRQMTAYCDSRVYVELNGNNPDSLRKAAAAIGFFDLQPDMGSNRYWLRYQSKTTDEQFFEAFKKLTELAWVRSAYFNTYREAEPDSRVSPAMDKRVD